MRRTLLLHSPVHFGRTRRHAEGQPAELYGRRRTRGRRAALRALLRGPRGRRSSDRPRRLRCTYAGVARERRTVHDRARCLASGATASYPDGRGSPLRVPCTSPRADRRCATVRGRGAEALQADAQRRRRPLHAPRCTAALEDRNRPRAPGARAPCGRLRPCSWRARVSVAGRTERVRTTWARQREDGSPGQVPLRRSSAG